MPVTSQIGCIVGHNHQMELARRYLTLTSGAQITLCCLIRLNRGDGHVEKIAHAIRAIITAIATTTMMMSKAVFLCSRNGLKPTCKR